MNVLNKASSKALAGHLTKYGRGDVMATLASFFDWINDLLGVSSGSELVLNPIFLGFCVLLLLYAFLAGQKIIGLVMVALLGGGAITHYLYPPGTPQLSDLLTYLAAMAGLVMLIIYFGFIRE
jgi:hypothetical protein